MATVCDNRLGDDRRTLPVRVPAVIPLTAASAGIPLVLSSDWPHWAQMWGVAVSVYWGLKWLTVVSVPTSHERSGSRLCAYLLLWPGMDAAAFLARSQAVASPARREWLMALFKTALGVLLLFLAPRLSDAGDTLAAWVGMTGIVFTLHFGLFHVLSIVWRQQQVNARPIMSNPILASSLSDFWSNRWNLAFRDLSHQFVFRPLVRRSASVVVATMAVFLLSGLVHDLVISVPARGGYGLPTVYFLIQGCGLLVERSRLARRCGAGSGLAGRLFCLVVVLGPAPLLFHRSFIEQVVLPMLATFKDW